MGNGRNVSPVLLLTAGGRETSPTKTGEGMLTQRRKIVRYTVPEGKHRTRHMPFPKGRRNWTCFQGKGAKEWCLETSRAGWPHHRA